MGGKTEPLTESYFYILLCLYEGPSHGYGIMRRTAELSGGSVHIGSGTMYGATASMTHRGWIEECPLEGGFQRRRMYQLTGTGKKILLDEIERLRRLSAAAELVLKGGDAQ